MSAIYHVYPDSAIVAYHVWGDDYNNAICEDYDTHGGYPVSKHSTAADAIAYRESLGAAWFGVATLSPMSEADIEEVF